MSSPESDFEAEPRRLGDVDRGVQEEATAAEGSEGMKYKEAADFARVFLQIAKWKPEKIKQLIRVLRQLLK